MPKRALVKVILLGDERVGKSSLMQRYCSERFREQYKPTIGADFLTKDVQIHERDCKVTLQIWDTAGQKRFAELGMAFYRGADTGVLVFDVTDRKSFEALNGYREEMLVQASPDDADNFPFVVIGNKSDLHADQQVTPSEALAFCESLGGTVDAAGNISNVEYFEVSCKSGDGLQAAFDHIARRGLEYSDPAGNEPPPAPAVDLNYQAYLPNLESVPKATGGPSAYGGGSYGASAPLLGTSAPLLSAPLLSEPLLCSEGDPLMAPPTSSYGGGSFASTPLLDPMEEALDRDLRRMKNSSGNWVGKLWENVGSKPRGAEDPYGEWARDESSPLLCTDYA